MSLLWRTALRRYSFNLSSSFSSFRPLKGEDFDRKQYRDRKLSKMENQERQELNRREQRPAVKKPKDTLNKPLRGRPRDQEDVRISKTLSWLLRHGAKSEGLHMRQDGYVRVQDLLALPRMRTVNMSILERLVQNDAKNRYHLYQENLSESETSSEGVWWIRANQGHSMKDIELELVEITSPTQVPMAVHGTNHTAWQTIEKVGLSPMKRTHIHMAQTTDKAKGANPGMRGSSQVLIYIDLEKALLAGIKFYLSDNGVVLSKGDETGYLPPKFFKRVTRLDGTPLSGWAGDEGKAQQSSAVQVEQGSPKEVTGTDEVRETVETLGSLNVKD